MKYKTSRLIMAGWAGLACNERSGVGMKMDMV